METTAASPEVVPEDGLLGLLEGERLKRTTFGAGSVENSKEQLMITVLYERFREVIEQHGDVTNKEDLKLLCQELDDAQTQIGAELDLPRVTLDRLTKIRIRIKSDIELRMRWKKNRREPWVDRTGKATTRTYEALNVARRVLGESEFEISGNQWMTAEEIRQSHVIASLLGIVAVADFWSHIDGSRFSFCDQTIQNLSQWIGDFETPGGFPINDIPIELLTWPSMAALRELLRNKLRDKLYTEHYKDSVQGVDPVIEELIRMRSEVGVGEFAREQFLDELEDYFIGVDDLKLPDNMREGMGQEAEFPAKHQRIAMMEIERQKQLLLADKTGGGKTGSSILAFEHLKQHGKAKRALILCPAEVVGEWEKRLTDVNGGYFKEGKPPNVVVIRRKKGKELRMPIWEKAKSADYVIMSIPMSRHETEGRKHVDLAQEIGADFFVLDEAHNVRNPEGEDTENIFKISQCDSIRNGYSVISTATPIYNTARDIAAIIRILNAGQERIKNTLGVPPDLDFNNIEQLSRAISGNHTRLVRNLLMLRTLRREGNDCLPVGTKLVIEPPSGVRLSPIEQAVYDAMKEDDPFFTATQKLHALRGILLTPQEYCPDMSLKEGTKYRQLKAAVLKRLENHAREPGTRSGKVLIGITRIGGFAIGTTRDKKNDCDPITSSIYSYQIGVLRKELNDMGIPVAILDGSVSDTQPLRERRTGRKILDKDGSSMTKTKRIIAQCRDHDGPAALAMRTDVGGEGIDLSSISDVEILCPPSVQAESSQLIGRLYRPGQKFDVHVGTHYIEGTIEQGMMEFAQRKHRIIEQLMDGKPLSHEEERILNDEISKVRADGYLASETMSPRRRLMWIFTRIFAQGKKRVKEMLEAEGGKYGKELAELYSELDEYSHQGNNRRLLFTLLEKHLPALKEQFGARLQMADIAAGTLSVARHMQHRKDLTVWSSDLTGAMVEVGTKSLPPNYPKERIAECAMDELPYEDESKHVAFHSLALHYTYNNRKKIGRGGDERVKALQELNRILVPGGIAFLALPTHTMADTAAFETFCTTLEAYFGFEVILEDTDLARSVDNEDEEPFETYVVTVRKIDKPCDAEDLPPEAWKALNLKRPWHGKNGNGNPPTNGNGHPPKKKPDDAGYHSEFVLGGKRRLFVPETAEAKAAKEEHLTSKEKYERMRTGVESLIKKHGTLMAVPVEELMAFSHHKDVDPDAQTAKEDLCRALLEEFGGKFDRIPLERIAAINPEILVRATTKKGTFVCFARVDGTREKIGMYGKRFFYQEDITGVAEHPPVERKPRKEKKKKNGKPETGETQPPN